MDYEIIIIIRIAIVRKIVSAIETQAIYVYNENDKGISRIFKFIWQ